MIFSLRRLLLRTIIKLYSKAWSAIIVLINLSWKYGGFIAMNKKYNTNILSVKNEFTTSNPSLKESVKERTALFYIVHKRLDNINWDSL